MPTTPTNRFDGELAHLGKNTPPLTPDISGDRDRLGNSGYLL